MDLEDGWIKIDFQGSVIFVFSGGGVGDYYLCQMYGFFLGKKVFIKQNVLFLGLEYGWFACGPIVVLRVSHFDKVTHIKRTIINI